MKQTLKNRNIEVLRGLAIVFVLVAHTHFIKDSEKVREYFDFTRGVDLFFIISGYLMGATYLSKLNLNRFEFGKAYNFYIKRICRLLPAAIFWNIVLLCLAYVWKQRGYFHSSNEVFRAVISHITFSGNLLNANRGTGLGYWWSLGLEAQFYLILPVLIYIFGNRIWKVILTILFVSCLVDVFVLFPNFWMFRFHSLFVGLLIWKISTQKEFGQIKTMMNRLSTIKVHSILIFLLLSALTLTRSINNNYQFSTNLLIAIMLGAAMLIAIAYDKGFFVCHLSGILIFMGKISYSLYISHIIIFDTGSYLLKRFGLDETNRWEYSLYVISLYVIAIIIAYLSYRYIEPMINKEKYLIKTE